MSLEPQKHTKRIENNQSQTMTFWTRQVLFPRGRLKWLTAVKNANVCWLLNFRICMFLKKCSNTLLRDWDGFLSPVAINDKDGHGLKLEKLGPTFSIFNHMTAEMPPKNIIVCAPWRNCRLDTCIYFIQCNSTGQTFGVKALSNDLSIEVT